MNNYKWITLVIASTVLALLQKLGRKSGNACRKQIIMKIFLDLGRFFYIIRGRWTLKSVKGIVFSEKSSIIICNQVKYSALDNSVRKMLAPIISVMLELRCI